MQSVATKKSLSSYTDCSIYLFFMCSQCAVRNTPQKESNLLRSAERHLHQPGVAAALHRPTSKPLLLSLSAVLQSVWYYRQAFGAFLAGADPTRRSLLRADGTTSALQTRISRIEDLAAEAKAPGREQAMSDRITLMPLQAALNRSSGSGKPQSSTEPSSEDLPNVARVPTS